MNNYADEEFKFFTERENFATMAKVANKAEKISKLLIEAFWLKLKEAIQKELSSTEDWIVEYALNFNERYCKLQIYKKSWKAGSENRLVAVSFENLHFGERPFIGVMIDRNNKQYDLEKVKGVIMEIDVLRIDRLENNSWWCNQRFLDFDFTNYEHFIDIVPSERDILIKNLTSEVVMKAKLIDEQIEDILRFRKEK